LSELARESSQGKVAIDLVGPIERESNLSGLQHGIVQSDVARGEAVLLKLPPHDFEYPRLRPIGVRYRQGGVLAQRYGYQDKAISPYGGVQVGCIFRDEVGALPSRENAAFPHAASAVQPEPARVSQPSQQCHTLGRRTGGHRHRRIEEWDIRDCAPAHSLEPRLQYPALHRRRVTQEEKRPGQPARPYRIGKYGESSCATV
jgi:hypothetical protein